VLDRREHVLHKFHRNELRQVIAQHSACQACPKLRTCRRPPHQCRQNHSTTAIRTLGQLLYSAKNGMLHLFTTFDETP
jgi:hypothetical protein